MSNLEKTKICLFEKGADFRLFHEREIGAQGGIWPNMINALAGQRDINILLSDISPVPDY
jgi:hypothetical protein